MLHNFMVLSLLPDARIFLSGDMQTE